MGTVRRMTSDPSHDAPSSGHPDRALLLLLDVREIEQLKHRYFRALDSKDWDVFADCLAPDVVADYGGLAFGDRDELTAYMRANLGPGMITLHQAHHPEIEVSGDLATGRWYLFDKVLVPAHDFALEGAAFYDDEYRRTPDGWRISRTGYRRTYEATFKPSAVPSLRITPGGVSPDIR